MAKVILLEFSVLYFVNDHFLRTNYEKQQYFVAVIEVKIKFSNGEGSLVFDVKRMK